MAKILVWNNALPVGGNPAGQGDDWIQSMMTYVDDEHVLEAVQNMYHHRQGSARPFITNVAGIPAPPAAPFGAPSTANDTGRLMSLTNGPTFRWDHGTLSWVRIVGGRYASVTPAPAAPIACLANTFTNITNFNIPAFDFQAYVYRLHANIQIAYQTLAPGAPMGLRFHVTDSALATWDYEYEFTTNASGYITVSLSALHDHATLAGALGNGTVDLQVWIPAVPGNVITTAYAAAGWTAGAYQYELTVMEV